MTKDNNTGKPKDFYSRGQQMFDSLNLPDDDDDTQVYADTLTIVYQRGFSDGKRAAQQQVEPVLQEIAQYRMQMAGISTAAIGYWKEGDCIHPNYDTVALRDVAKLYAKYDELYKLKEQP